MTHGEMEELYELYVLGALDASEASAIDEHLEASCSYCLASVRRAMLTTSALAELADPIEAPVAVRKRLLAAIEPHQSKRFAWLVPALLVLCAALLALVVWSRTALDTTRQRLATVVDERNQLKTAVQILTRSETRTIQFGPSNEVPHGRVLVNPRGGFVVTGSDLPQIASDKTFELWLVPANGQAPQPAGTFRPDAGNSFVHVSSAPVDPAKIAAIAVSVEPAGGSAAPTTKPFLIVKLT